MPMIYKISPDPSLQKRGTQLVPDMFIIPLWKRGAYFPPFFHHTIRYRATGALPEAAIAFKIKCEIMS